MFNGWYLLVLFCLWIMFEVVIKDECYASIPSRIFSAIIIAGFLIGFGYLGYKPPVRGTYMENDVVYDHKALIKTYTEKRCTDTVLVQDRCETLYQTIARFRVTEVAADVDINKRK